MFNKKKWCSPQLYGLNFRQTQVNMEHTTPSNIVVDMSTSYEAPVDIANVSSSTTTTQSSTSDYCFSTIS